MNMQEKIERLLRAAPRPPVPETLFDKLKKDIPAGMVRKRRGIVSKYFATTGGAISRWRVAAIVGIMSLLPLSYGATKLIQRFISISHLPTIKVDFPYGGALSPDGRHFAGTIWNGQLTVIDILNGQKRNLLENCWESSVVWSADGTEMAVISYSGQEKKNLLAVSLKTGKTRILMEDPPYLLDWSADGKYILAGRTNKAKIGIRSTFIVNLESKKETTLTENTAGLPSARFSPKGDCVSYVTKEADRSVLHLQRIDGTNHLKYADFPGRIGNALWSPDGSYIVFKGTQKGIGHEYKDLWALRVQGNQFVGSHFPVVPDVEQMQFYNFSQNGQLAYRTGFRLGGTFVLPIDLRTGKATGEPRQLVRGSGEHCWSPDGKQIAVRQGSELSFISANNGEMIRNLSLPDIGGNQSYHGRGISWSPDGRWIVFGGFDRDKRTGIFLVTVDSGDTKLLVPLEERIANFDPTWAPDSKTIAYGYKDEVYLVNIEEQKPRCITMTSDELRQEKVIRPVFAPDGRSVAYMTGRRILATTVDGLETREIFHLKDDKQIINIFDWSPDGRYIVFTPGNKEIWCALTDGGESFKIAELPEGDESQVYAFMPKWSPKGDSITFIVSREKYQYWVMENFLPVE